MRIGTGRAAIGAANANSSGLHRRHFLLLAAFCLLLFGYEMFSGRALSMHEARLPETSREMLIGRNWMFPQSGGRPWLERPPVPHWILVGTSVLLGQRVDSVWVVRLPSVVMGTIVVLLTAWMAGAWFGREVGLLSGFVLATMYEFYAYSVLAEDDIFLAATVALAVAAFVRLEFVLANRADLKLRFLGNRPWEVWAFYILLGLTNMVKSPLIGAIVVFAPVAGYALWTRDWIVIRRYTWLWGWIIFTGLLVAWPLAAAHRYPDVWQNWFFDYTKTHEFDEPWWYYASALAGFGLPWIWASAFGCIGTWKEVRRPGAAGEKFLWCWAFLAIVALSLPHRKHHHYMVPSLAPWAILSAIGVRDVGRGLMRLKVKPINPLIATLVCAIFAAVGLTIFRKKIEISWSAVIALMGLIVACIGVFFFGIGQRRGAIAAAACFIGIGVAYCWGQSFTTDLVADDTAFLHRVDHEVPADGSLYVNSDLGGDMDFFRNQFYLRPSAMLLHNLTFLRDRAITAPSVWIVTRKVDEQFLQTLGDVKEVDQSAMSRRETSPTQRFTLFYLTFKPGLQRYPRPPYVNTLQAMDRAHGPYCGPPLPPRHKSD